MLYGVLGGLMYILLTLAGISEDEKRITTQLVYHFREGKEVSLSVWLPNF